MGKNDDVGAGRNLVRGLDNRLAFISVTLQLARLFLRNTQNEALTDGGMPTSGTWITLVGFGLETPR